MHGVNSCSTPTIELNVRIAKLVTTVITPEKFHAKFLPAKLISGVYDVEFPAPDISLLLVTAHTNLCVSIVVTEKNLPEGYAYQEGGKTERLMVAKGDKSWRVSRKRIQNIMTSCRSRYTNLE